jgi:hypothetical protein
MGENPSPLGEAFKVDDPLAPPAEAGGLGREGQRGLRLGVEMNCVSVHGICFTLSAVYRRIGTTAFKAVVLGFGIQTGQMT